MRMPIVVLGAGGQLGREAVTALIKRAHEVCAVVRRQSNPPFDSAVEVRLADARNNDQVRPAISGFESVVNVRSGS
jgi:uncharacterized protein YbjT (DUF2867 family)